MNTKLLECKREAKDLYSRRTLREKHGYMAIMKQLWDNSEFADLNLSTQNLWDQASRIEKSLGSAGSTIREESNTANELLQSNVDNQETSSEDLEQDNYESNNDTISPRNLPPTNKSHKKMKRLLKWKTSSKRQNWFLLQWRGPRGFQQSIPWQ